MRFNRDRKNYLLPTGEPVYGYKRAYVNLEECAFAIKHKISYVEAVNKTIGTHYQDAEAAKRAIHSVDDTPETIELFVTQYAPPTAEEISAVYDALQQLEDKNIHFTSNDGNCVIPVIMTPKQFEIAIYRALPDMDDYVTIEVDTYDRDLYTSVF